MGERNIDYEIRRRAELKRHLGMSHIAEHVSEVVTAQRNQRDAAHLHLRVIGARYSAGDIRGRIKGD